MGEGGFVGKDLRAIFCGSGTMSWQAIACGSRVFTPDMTKAYAGFKLSKAFPMVSELGFAIAAPVVARSWMSLQDQQVNLFHQLKFYDPANRKRDRIVGSVAAVEFPPAPEGGWKLAKNVDDAPMIAGVMTLAKLADGVEELLGAAQSGKQNFTVSMECFSDKADSGFAVKLDTFRSTDLDWQWTPDDFKAQGWCYVPWEKADAELRGVMKKSADGIDIVTKYRQKPTVMLQGGLTGEVHYAGVGLVNHGFEPSAELERILAGVQGEVTTSVELRSLLAPLENFVRETEKCVHALDNHAKT